MLAAVAHSVPVVAANAPYRYVSVYARLGSGALSALLPDASAVGLPPLPIAPTSAQQVSKLDRELRRGVAIGGAAVTKAGILSERLFRGQALWDAAMAHSIAARLKTDSAALVMHVCGKFHMEEATGIPEHLGRYAPHARITSVTHVMADFSQVHRFLGSRPLLSLHGSDWVPGTVYTLDDLRCLADFVVLTDGSAAQSDLMAPQRSACAVLAQTGNVSKLPAGQYLAGRFVCALLEKTWQCEAPRGAGGSESGCVLRGVHDPAQHRIGHSFQSWVHQR
jgi:hypothetical protein